MRVTEEFEQAMHKAFRFRPGDVVALRNEFVTTEAEFAIAGPIDKYPAQRVSPPVAVTIVERIVQQCSGGVQLFYKVTNQPGTLTQIAEWEAMLYAEAVEARKKFAPNYEHEENEKAWAAELANKLPTGGGQAK